MGAPDVEIIGRALTTLPADDEHPYRTGPWRPQTTERAVADVAAAGLVVQGRIPEDLDGVYLRNTENPLHPAIERYHPFDGDGMIHSMSFRGGTAAYRNRFVRTTGFEAEQAAKRSLWAGTAEPARLAVDPRSWGARHGMKDPASTDVVVHAGKAIATFYTCGQPYRLDPLTLETLDTAPWEPDGGVSAHTKVDEATGELHFFTYSTVAPYLHYGIVDAENRLVHHTPVPLPGPRTPHDMALTERYAIFNDLPLSWDVDLLAKGVYVPRMHDRPSRLGIMPKRGGPDDVVWFDADPTYVLHWVNAYEDGDEVVLDGFFQHAPVPEGAPPLVDDPYLRTMDPAEARLFRYVTLDGMQTRLHRWRFNLATGLSKEEPLREDITEFGIINTSRLGQPYRYTWAATGKPGWFLFDGLVRHDVESGTDQRLDLPDGVFCSEAGMAPRLGGSGAEDDGYVITFTTDVARDVSECVVLDAADITAEPVATIRLPERISSGTHATWAPGHAIPGWGDTDRPVI